MKALLLLLVLVSLACKSPEELIVEAATGGKVDIKDGKVTVKGEDGEVVTMTAEDGEEGGKVTITNEKGETATIDGDEGTMRITSKDGVAEFGTGKLPKGFPLELIEGAEVMSSTKTKKAKGPVFHVMAQVASEPKVVGDFYAEALAEAGFKKVKRTSHDMGDGGMVTLNSRKKNAKVSIVAVKEKEGALTALTINWNAR